MKKILFMIFGCSVGDLALQLAERHTTNTSKVIGIDREEQ